MNEELNYKNSGEIIPLESFSMDLKTGVYKLNGKDLPPNVNGFALKYQPNYATLDVNLSFAGSESPTSD